VRLVPKFLRMSLIAILCAAPLVQARADTGDALQFYEEEAQVTTATRRPQSISDSPVTVEVITREEIEASGAVNLWDLMRFRVGMDVIDARTANSNRAIVSVRGFPEEFVDGLQVLVDGRSVYVPLTGGVFWQEIPVQIQDVQRIEIVRGPNAALYGSNAALGVVNIITKRPEEDKKLSLSGIGGSQAFFQSAESAEGSFMGGNGRISHTYRTEDGFPDSNGNKTHDAMRSNKANYREDWKKDNLSLQVMAGGTWDDEGIIASPDNQTFLNHFQMAKGTLDLGRNSAVEVTGSRSDFTPVGYDREYQYDAEILHRFGWGNGKLNTVYGGSFRNSIAESPILFTALDPQRRNQTVRSYVNQSIHVSKKTDLNAAYSLESSDSGDTQPAYQASIMNRPFLNHAFRLSYSHASIMPAMYAQYSDLFDNGIHIRGNRDIKPSQLSSYEVSYQGEVLDKKLQLENNYFYMVKTDLQVTDTGFTPPSTVTIDFRNGNNAVARGTEAKLTYHFPHGKAYANYTFETISDNQEDVSVTRATPKHKANFGGFARWRTDWSANIDCGYKDGYTMTNLYNVRVDIPAYWRVDVKLSRTIGRYELYILGQNLMVSRHIEFPDAVEVPRQVLGGVSFKFRGSL